MSALIGALRVSLSLETAAFEKGATLALKRAAGLRKKFQRLGRDLQDVGAKMSLGITAPLSAFGAMSFQAASDAAELQSAFDQTFGSMSKVMNEWAETTGNTLGRSTREIQDAANAFGIFFNTAVDQKEAAKMSQTFAVLAQDLSSFYNVSGDIAQQRLLSGLAGEAEPLRKFGVFINAAAVEAKALELGLSGVGNELTEQEKIVARYALIMEQTKNAQGDVIRTADGTANQMRRAAAAFEELQIVVGTKLLPVITPLIDKLASLIEWFVQLPKPVQNVALGLAAVTAVAGPVLFTLGSLITVVGKSIPLLVGMAKAWGAIKVAFLAARIAALATLPVLAPFLAPLAAITVAIGAVWLAWKNWDKIVPFVSKIYRGVKTWLMDKLNAVFDWLKGKLNAVGDWFYDLYDRVVGNSYVPDMVDGIAKQMQRLQSEMVAPAQKATAQVADAFRELRGEVAGLFDRLFPERAESLQFQRDLELINLAVKELGFSADVASQAVIRLLKESGRLSDVPVTINAEPIANGLGKVKADLEAIPELAQRIDNHFAAIADRGLRTLADGLAAVFTEGAKLGDVLLDTLRQIVHELLRAQIYKMLGSLFGGIGLPFGGARAMGGPVSTGSAYLVGERGPEMFVPQSAGTIVPNHAMAGGFNAPITQNFYGQVSRETLRQSANATRRAVADVSRKGF